MLTSDEVTLRSTLVRSGFLHPDSALSVLRLQPELVGHIQSLAKSANPDQSLSLVAQIVVSAEIDSVSWQQQQWDRLIAVVGHSNALGTFLVRHPECVNLVVNASGFPTAETLREAFIPRVEAVTDSQGFLVSAKKWEDGIDALRIEYHSWVSLIAALDLQAVHESPRFMEPVADALTNLADAVLEAALACARNRVESHEACVMSIVSLGKCGARELNYVSDVDVIFVVQANAGEFNVSLNPNASLNPNGHEMVGSLDQKAIEVGTQLAKLVMQACSQVTTEGSIWQVDANLRPEGRSGALVRTIESYLTYYQQWAHGWEFQAFMKARPSAGNLDLGKTLIDHVFPLVWEASASPGFVQDVQDMRSMVISQIPTKELQRELKLGRGGLRDVEFAVQLLQLVHGRSDVMIRSSHTLLALEQLATWGYVGRQDASQLANAYRFLRTLEHRIQLIGMHRTHLMPTDEESLRQIGRSIGYFANPVEELTEQWKVHATIIRRIHEKLFYRPLLSAVAHLDGTDRKLSAEAATERLRILGYSNPQSALSHIRALTSGVSRRANIQKTLLPVLLEWFSATPNPDEGILGFRNVSDALGGTPWFLRLLRDESVTAQRLVNLLGSSKYVTNLLMRAPQAVQMLADDSELVAQDIDALRTEAGQIISRHDVEDAVAALRSLRRRELFRISAAHVLEMVNDNDVGLALTDLNDAVIEATVNALIKALNVDFEFIVIAMGRYGGGETSYASDVDVMYCSLAQTESQIHQSQQLASQLASVLGTPSVDPELKLDADLRPEGRNGSLVQTLDAFTSYYQNWSSPWEAQALLRARVAVGTPLLSRRFVELIDPIRYSPAGISAEALREMRKLKARMESERLPRGIDPTSHIKLGPGGLSDVEWLVQLQQLRYGHRHPELRVTNTLHALQACIDLSYISERDGETLLQTWTFLSKLRNALALVKATTTEVFPRDVHEQSQVAHLLQYGNSASQQLVEDYLRLTRRCRSIFNREFYGYSD